MGCLWFMSYQDVVSLSGVGLCSMCDVEGNPYGFILCSIVIYSSVCHHLDDTLRSDACREFSWTQTNMEESERNTERANSKQEVGLRSSYLKEGLLLLRGRGLGRGLQKTVLRELRCRPAPTTGWNTDSVHCLFLKHQHRTKVVSWPFPYRAGLQCTGTMWSSCRNYWLKLEKMC